ncbi:protein Aster-B isoform X11 [Sturnira hondurensis]|uniref:protein Aster-B isoform X11 n=1 Tax=Sturnira hondurensis TaxID=192404 RepID=UPI00187A1795|nr:protein Aster-B isoform X11 [Sturnira hondurensis]
MYSYTSCHRQCPPFLDRCDLLSPASSPPLSLLPSFLSSVLLPLSLSFSRLCLFPLLSTSLQPQAGPATWSAARKPLRVVRAASWGPGCRGRLRHRRQQAGESRGRKTSGRAREPREGGRPAGADSGGPARAKVRLRRPCARLRLAPALPAQGPPERNLISLQLESRVVPCERAESAGRAWSGTRPAGELQRRGPMPAANLMENLQLPALQVPGLQGAPEGSPVRSSSSTPTLCRRRFKIHRTKNVHEQSLKARLARDLPGVLAPGKEFLQLPAIEITPSSDEDTPWSNCSTPSASPRRKRFLLRKWLRVRERKECSESSSQQSSQQSSHDDDSSRFLSPRAQEESTASNSNRSTPACSPILRKRSRSPTPQSADGDTMVEKGSDHSSDKSPSTPEQGVQRSCSSQSGRSTGKNSKSHKRLSKGKEALSTGASVLIQP